MASTSFTNGATRKASASFKEGATALKGGANAFKGGASRAMTQGVGCCGEAWSGFRDFILRGNVVDLAIAIVVGDSFKDLINAFVTAFVTPLIGMINPNSTDNLAFYIRGSKFQYGLFLDALISFIIICSILYFMVVLPLMTLLVRVYPNLAITRECPECLMDDVPAYANRCKHCCSTLTPARRPSKKGMEEDDEEVVTRKTIPKATSAFG